MAGYTDVVKRELRPRLQSLADDLKARRQPDFFWPTGTQVYVGRQGSGKTISAIHHLRKLQSRYPKAKVVSNILFTERRPVTFTTRAELREASNNLDTATEYLYFADMDQLALALVEVNNDFYGVIYVIDEIHTYFNALDSKNIPMFVFTEISQQRKQRKLIVGTSQLFLRMAKPLREQCDSLIMCNTLFGVWTFQRAFDGMSMTQDYDGSLSGTIKKNGWFWHTRALRNSFDTYQKVVSGVEQFEEVTRIEIRDKKKKMFGKT